MDSDDASGPLPVTHMVLACDESGAKGYADRDENTPGETGVFAGILIPEEVLETASTGFDAVARRYRPNHGKLHIADLEPQDQHALREEIFSLVRQHQLPCFYEAIHVAGFQRAYEHMAERIEQEQAARRSSIKISSNRHKPSSMHAALFQGLYAKMLAFCMERRRLHVSLEVRTDRVDSPLVKDFEREAAELLNYGAQIKRVTGFDTATQKIVESEIRIGDVGPEDQLPLVVQDLAIKVVDDSDGLVLGADILANSLDYHFRSRSDEHRFRDLNNPEAFSGHPLSDCLDAYCDWGTFDSSDTLYAHPRRPDR
jgi:hypothetical protein